MELKDIKKLVETSKFASELFGSDPEDTYKKFAFVTHPDRNSGNDELFKKITSLYESLSKPLQVKSPIQTYILGNLLKAGDVADIYYAKGEDKENYLLKASRVEGGYKLLENEERNLKVISDDAATSYLKYFPSLVESFPAHEGIQKRINIFKEPPETYYSSEHIHTQLSGLPGEHLAWMFNRFLVGLGYIHQRGYVHGAILPSHVLFDLASHGCKLVGWGHSVKLESIVTTISSNYKEFYPTEILTKEKVLPSTDLYMAAKLMLYLAGNTKIPQEQKRFWQSCLLDSKYMRSNDCWALHDEHKEMLKNVYGKPKFISLELPN